MVLLQKRGKKRYGSLKEFKQQSEFTKKVKAVVNHAKYGLYDIRPLIKDKYLIEKAKSNKTFKEIINDVLKDVPNNFLNKSDRATAEVYVYTALLELRGNPVLTDDTQWMWK